MRRLAAFGLAVLLPSLLGYMSLAPAGERPKPLQATPEQCQAPAYVVPGPGELPYRQGSEVTNRGRAYQCKRDSDGNVGAWAWCNQGPYEPGKSDSADAPWRAAWNDLGACPAEPETNTLSLSFSTVTGRVPFKAVSKGVGPQAQRDLQVSGVLRCKEQEIPFSGRSDEGVVLHDLPACKYDVIMHEAQGYLPLTTPTQVEFKADTPEKISLELKFRQPLDLSRLVTLPGVKVELFASGLYQPRQMAMGNRVLYVGSSAIPVYTYEERTAGYIYAIPLDEAGKPTAVHLLASGLEEPHGVVYRDGDLYYSTSGKLYRVRNVDQTYRDARPEPVMNFPADDTAFPLGRPGLRIFHQKHPLHFNPIDPSDKGLYTAVGIPCNSCIIPPDGRYGTVLRYDMETGASQVLAKGVRNAVGFTWHPDGKIWFTDNNRGGYLNSDEVNLISEKDLHFGVPYFYGRDVPGFTQEEYQEPGSIVPPLVEGAIVSDKPLHQLKPEDYQAPAYELGSNTAPLGIEFWNGFYNDGDDLQRLLVAVHGTGTKASPGMELRMLTVKDGREVINQIPLVTGWGGSTDDFNVYCLDDSCLGRPTDMLPLSDNALLVSDDLAGVIYRITFDAGQVAGKSTLKLQPTEAPNPAVRPLMISGTLKDGEGRSRRFDVAWGESPLSVKGLIAGTYTVTLDNVGELIPRTRQQQVVLSGASQVQTVELAYIERPPFEPIKASLVAPDKPAFAGQAPEQWEVTLSSDGHTQVVKVPWGGTREVLLQVGKHTFNFPYYQSELPEPTQQVVDIDEDSRDGVTVQMHYQHVPELGRQVVATTCANCHTVQYFQDANKAINWSLAGKEALVQQILGMTVRGHCDTSCAGQVADYFYSELWADYLDPGQTFGKRQLRLLTRDEYVNSVRDLFTVQVDPEALPADKFDRVFKYAGEADAGVIQPEDLKTLYDMAWHVAEKVNPQWLAEQSVEGLGHRVFRRPLAPDELARYADMKREHGDQSLVASLLLSPHYLYRSELGAASGRASAGYQLTANERATALSYALLGTTPSEALMRQAEQGQLETPEQIGDVAEQMLLSEQGTEQFNRFIGYYLRTKREIQEKPGLEPAVIQSMINEQAHLVREVLKSGGAFDALFNPGYTFLDQRLAEQYGIEGVTGEAMRKVTVDERRGGLLHLGATQAANSDYQATSLVKRGIMIREQLLCREFGAPVDADPQEPQFPPKAITTRERWDLVNGEHASEGRCWQCHKYMNDTGSSMENYDASGRYRETEPAYNHAQFPVQVKIDASGPFISNTGLENWATVHNVRDIARLLPSNLTAQTCMADSYFRFMFGNKVSAGSVATLKSAAEALKSNGSLIQMIRELAASPVFLNREEEN
ncbi:hypothetical protein D3C76_437100 [compost metagenome]|jgi:glucose/arabinose dehydrogenase|uniref:DUF1588 domain-containing protein n=1 Tax=Pseudomonas TaxID=286 RepID=UPI000FBCA640|nr:MULTISPECIES: DUF1588 domain-containing protein [unclassified Pseudomonas]MDD2131320.1 DUF1588 domain-containing protein [Pseudomonas sp. 17391]UPL05635.1 hypothetical protein PisoF_01294 [Pseudomonas sp. IsoF]